MANYASSVLVTAQAKLGTKYNEAELRRKEKPVLNMAVRNQDYAIPNHQILKVAEARPVDVKYFAKKAAGAATAKVALHTGTKGDSGSVTLSFNTIVEKFYLSRKQAQNNVIAYQDMFNFELEQAIQNIRDRAETAGLAALVAGRLQTAAPTTSGAGTWNNTNKALEISAGNAAYFALYAKQYLRGRYFSPDYDVVADLLQATAFEKVANQGAGNSTNTGFQFAGMNIAATQETILGAYTAGSALIMPAGTFAGLVWNDPKNRSGVNEGNNNVGMLGTLADPFGSGAIFDVSMYTVRRDESANGGHAQDIADEWEIALQIGWALPPLVTANESAVHLIAQA
jgi:uncharacterized protein YbjQ (UPF0145 family)